MDNNYAPEVRTPGKAIACLIMGICSLVFSSAYGMGFIFAIIGLVLFGQIKKQVTEIPKMAKIGKILCTIGLILDILIIVGVILVFGLAILAEYM